jgi:hypothetical protein
MEGIEGPVAPPAAEVAMVEPELVRQIRELAARGWNEARGARARRGAQHGAPVRAHGGRGAGAGSAGSPAPDGGAGGGSGRLVRRRGRGERGGGSRLLARGRDHGEHADGAAVGGEPPARASCGGRGDGSLRDGTGPADADRLRTEEGADRRRVGAGLPAWWRCSRTRGVCS